MPELPEVETVRRTLEYQLKDVKIKDVNIIYPKIIDNVTPEEFKQKLKNQQFQNYRRIGKYLIFELSDYTLVTHLRMEGKFYIKQDLEAYEHKHTHLIFELSDGRKLQYHDTRKFGRMYLYPRDSIFFEQKAFQNVGLDAFDPNLQSINLYKKSRNRKITLKQFLLDQKNIAGIGNIYADEICFRVGLHPTSTVGNLNKKDFENILDATRIILQGAIDAGGTTIRSYTSSLGVDGRFQLQLKVHQRKGENCYRCGHVIEKTTVGGRGTYICQKCQKKK